MTTTTLLACLAAVTALTLAPGPDTVLVIRNSGQNGSIAGLFTALGICLGLYIHASLSAFGLSSLLMHTAWAYTAVKIAGAFYLCWLGIRSLLQARHSGSLAFFPTGNGQRSPLSNMREGFFCNVLNPKAIICYMAFLPQFINPDGNIVAQSLLIATLHLIVAMCYLGILAFSIDRAKKWFLREKVNKIFNVISGAILVIFGALLLVEE